MQELAQQDSVAVVRRHSGSSLPAAAFGIAGAAIIGGVVFAGIAVGHRLRRTQAEREDARNGAALMDRLATDFPRGSLPPRPFLGEHQASTVVRYKTKDFDFIYNPNEGERGTLTIVSLKLGGGGAEKKFAVLDLSWRLIDGSKTVAQDGLHELERQSPDAFRSITVAVERAAP